MKDFSQANNTPQALADEGLRCPECEYNLTGLDRDVCPECGEAFDRERLLGELASAQTPIPIWCRRVRVGTLIAFVQTLFEIWFHPIRFAKRFPTNPDQREARLFSRYCLGAAIVIAVPPYLLSETSARSSVLMASATCFSVMLGVMLCEWFSAAALFVPFKDDNPAEAPFAQDLALVRMTRAYLLLSASFIGVNRLGDLFLGGSWGSDWLETWGLWTVVFYWWVCMACIAKARCASLANLFLCVAMLPVCVAVSVAVAGAAGAIFFIALM